MSPLQASYFFSVSETIWGGTAEIQRNIVCERVLGLPKEPKPLLETLRRLRALLFVSRRPRTRTLSLGGNPRLSPSSGGLASSIALDPIADAAPTARATRGLAACEIHPTRGPPSGAVPRNPIAYRAMTRPRIAGSTRIWIVELAVAMNAIESAPIGTITIAATRTLGDERERKDEEAEPDPHHP